MARSGYKKSNGVRNSIVRHSGRAKKYKMGGQRKYPSKWCWEFIGHQIHCVEVRYFSTTQKYHFFKFQNSVMTRGSRVPSDRQLFDSPIDCYNNRPGVIHPLKEKV